MAISIYDLLVPPVSKMLTNLDNVLKKAEADCETRKIDPSVLVSARLAPDMFPLVRQVQIMTDQAKGGASRLAGLEPPKWPDEEKTFADLHARLAKAMKPTGAQAHEPGDIVALSFATPDDRPGAIVQFHMPRFRKDRAEALERSLLVRLSQNVLTCPTTACS